jgi:uncharacterized protein (DUF1501 family)
VSLERLNDRKHLLQALDGWRSDLEDSRGPLAGHDAFTIRALEMIASGQARAAFDLAREPEKVREKFKDFPNLLLARRLIEAGVCVVTIPLPCEVNVGGRNWNNWDTHHQNFEVHKAKLPLLDHAVHTLVTDLVERGLDQDVVVLVWGEFGRKPRVGDEGPTGRGHWPEASFALLAGGGLRLGQVVGGTDRRAERARHVPYTAQNVLATVYHVLGIDAEKTTVPDFSGRPMYLLDDQKPIAALV